MTYLPLQLLFVHSLTCGLHMHVSFSFHLQPSLSSRACSHVLVRQHGVSSSSTRLVQRPPTRHTVFRVGAVPAGRGSCGHSGLLSAGAVMSGADPGSAWPSDDRSTRAGATQHAHAYKPARVHAPCMHGGLESSRVRPVAVSSTLSLPPCFWIARYVRRGPPAFPPPLHVVISGRLLL